MDPQIVVLLLEPAKARTGKESLQKRGLTGANVEESADKPVSREGIIRGKAVDR